MPWQLYIAEPHSDIDDVLKELTGFLPSIDVPEAIATAKIAAMNGRKIAARGIVIYNTSIPPRNEGIRCTNWQVQTFLYDGDYERDLYNPALNLINGLADADAQSSIIAMSEYRDDRSAVYGSLSVWYAQSQ